MIRRVLITTLLILCGVSGTAMTVFGASDEVTVVVDQNYPPYMFGTKNQAKGLYPRLIEAVFARIGIEVDIQALPWDEALKAGEQGETAVGGIYKNNKRLEIYDYSSPLYEERLMVYTKTGETFPFNTLSDLYGKRIGLIRGWSYGEAFDAAREKYHFTVEEADSNLRNFEKLVSGKIDCLVVDQLAASQIIQEHAWDKQVHQLEKTAADNHAYLVFAKNLKKTALLERFNQALEEIKKDGSYQKLVRNFISRASE